MILSARMLNNVVDVNHWEDVVTLESTQGDIFEIYFALIDASVAKTKDPAGRRYVAPSGSTLSVTIQDIDSSITITKSATRPFSGDQSIWKISVNPLVDTAAVAGICGSYALKLLLTEPGQPNPLPAVWSSGTTYAVDNLVLLNGTLWRSLQSANLNNSPDTSPLWWVQMNIVSARVYSGFVSHALSVARIVSEF